MQPHRPSQSVGTKRPGDGQRKRGRRGDAQPLDRAWLEQRALFYVARWESTARGVHRNLERKIRERCARTGESPETGLELIAPIVAALVERDYVNDHRYATALIERLQRQGRSRAGIRAQLAAKGIDQTLAGELMRTQDSESETRSAWRLARRRRLGPYCLDPEKRREARHRHLAILGRQGFDRETAVRIIDAESLPEPD